LFTCVFRRSSSIFLIFSGTPNLNLYHPEPPVLTDDGE